MCGNMNFISSVDQDISQVNKANKSEFAVPCRKKKQHPRTKILLRKQGFRILEIYTKTIRGNAPLFSLSDI